MGKETKIVVALGGIAVVGTLLYRYVVSQRKTKAFVEAGHVKALRVHPVKSCRAVYVDEVYVDQNGGFRDAATRVLDRGYVVTDESGSFLTARQVPRLVLVQPHLRADHLELTVVDRPEVIPLRVPFNPTGDVINVRVWNRRTDGKDCGDEAARWLTDVTGRENIRLLHCSPEMITHKPRNDLKSKRFNFQFGHEKVGFQDLTPCNILSEESLADVERLLPNHSSILRFKPNIVVRGCKQAYDEDLWDDVHVGSAELRFVTRSRRCIQTTVDPDTGVRDADKKPMSDLDSYRYDAHLKGGCLGMDCSIVKNGVVTVGDVISVTYRNDGGSSDRS